MVDRRRGKNADGPRAAADIEPRATAGVGHGRTGPLRDQPGGRNVPVRQAALLDEGVELPFAT